ncbi:MAG: hypothetical protein PHS49_05020 [Candidatus Gracilibacteria bacterium]|nr:hypothetical protein [Candidatus Gracilibacteria bacterium]
MDKVDIIGGLQVLNTTDGMGIHERVNNALEDTITDYYSVLEIGGDSLNISPIEYFQCENGNLIKKLTKNESINTYRLETYEYLCKKLGKDFVNNLLFVINTSSSSEYIDNLIKPLTDKGTIEMIKVLVYFEADLVGKGHFYNGYLDQIYESSIYPESSKVFGIYLFESGYYEVSYKFLTKLFDFEKLLSLVNELLDNNKIDDEEFNTHLQYIYQSYLDNYLMQDNNYDNLIKFAEKGISLGVDCQYHIIYGNIQKGDLMKASIEYNNWRGLSKNKKSFLAKNPLKTLEEFYLFGAENGIFGSVELLLKFYREEFANNGFNDDYFEKILFFTSEGDYYFTDADKLIFDKFDEYINSFDNLENIKDLVNMLFDKYIRNNNAVYLDKILLICRKFLRGGYGEDMDLKMGIAIGFENLVCVDMFHCNPESTDEMYKSELKNLLSHYVDMDYLKRRFDSLLLQVCIHNLHYIEDLSKGLDIATSLTSIFDYYGYTFDEHKNFAFEYDKFYVENTQNKKALNLH